MSFDRERLRKAVTSLAKRGVLLGTSSWKYPGWVGQLYTGSRYEYRGKLAKTRFERDCLEEYAEVFKTVSVDAGYYRFPSQRYLEGLISQVPEDFRFAFKVTDEITIKHFPKLARHGDRAGKDNEHFLDAELFQRAFLAPCEPFRANIGVLMFEFSRFYPSDFAQGRDFVEALDAFLAQLPREWQYGVEIRNGSLLQPDYFDTLRRHQVAHVYNHWDRMPSAGEQMALDGSLTTDFAAARFLLRPGRKYQEAVDRFQPYDRVQEKQDDARAAGARLIKESLERNPSRPEMRPTQLFVNNRLEGNALFTLEAMLEAAGLLS